MDINSDATILLAAADAIRLALLRDALQGRYRLVHAASAQEAQEFVNRAARPDLAVLDASLAGQDPVSLCRELKSGFLGADLPVIIVSDALVEGAAFAAGAADVVHDPAHASALRARVAAHVGLRRARAMLAAQDARVSAEATERTRTLSQVQDATVLAIAALAERQQPGVHHHILRTQHFVVALARELRFNPRFSAELTDERIALLFRAAPSRHPGQAGQAHRRGIRGHEAAHGPWQRGPGRRERHAGP